MSTLGGEWATGPLADVDPLGPGGDEAHDAGVDEAIMDDHVCDVEKAAGPHG